MNQILNTSILKNKKRHSFLFKIQLIVSIIVLVILILYIYKNRFLDYENDDFSKTMYQTMQLKSIYSTNNIGTAESAQLYFCSIVIPKIDLEYPVSLEYTEELLKLSPCKFYGPNLNEIRKYCNCRS